MEQGVSKISPMEEDRLAVISKMFKVGVPAMAFYLGGLTVGVFFERSLGIAVAAFGGLLLMPFFDAYCGYLKRHNPRAFLVLRIAVALAIPLNVMAFKLNGAPEGLTFGGAGFEDAFRAVSMLGWGVGGMAAFIYALLKPRV